MALLRGPRAVETLTRMARLGVLGQWIPAFARVSGRMQFDLRPIALGPLLEASEHQTAGFASEYGVSVHVEPVAYKPWGHARQDR